MVLCPVMATIKAQWQVAAEAANGKATKGGSQGSTASRGTMEAGSLGVKGKAMKEKKG